MRPLMILAAAALPLGACHASWEKEGHSVQPSGKEVTRSYDLNGFTAIALSGSDDVEVTAGDAFKVEATADANLLDKLDIRLDGTTLHVGRQRGVNWGWNRGARIRVTMPKLTAVSLSGSGNLRADRAEGDFAGNISGSGDVSIAQLAGGSVKLSSAGSGNLKVGAGTATSLSADTAGSGDIDAKGLTVGSASVSVVGSGNVSATVNGGANVSIAGSGDVDLGGNARCKISSVGSGDVRCG